MKDDPERDRVHVYNFETEGAKILATHKLAPRPPRSFRELGARFAAAARRAEANEKADDHAGGW